MWFAGRADVMRLFQRTLFRQADAETEDAVKISNPTGEEEQSPRNNVEIRRSPNASRRGEERERDNHTGKKRGQSEVVGEGEKGRGRSRVQMWAGLRG